MVLPQPHAGGSKTLLQIQEEEAERQAQLAEQEAAAAAAAAAAGGPATVLPTGWAKAAASGLIGVVSRAKSLKQIQEEEMRARASEARQQAQQQQAAAAAAARAGPTLGCAPVAGGQSLKKEQRGRGNEMFMLVLMGSRSKCLPVYNPSFLLVALSQGGDRPPAGCCGPPALQDGVGRERGGPEGSEPEGGDAV